jgi:hypothetical protein
LTGDTLEAFFRRQQSRNRDSEDAQGNTRPGCLWGLW